MKTRLGILITVIAMAIMTLALPASADQSDCVGSTHPGHCGYVASGGANYGAPPVNHFHAPNGDVAPVPGYEPGAGGWGALVSEAAKGQGLKKAHGG
jgi:hypothetical protein